MEGTESAENLADAQIGLLPDALDEAIVWSLIDAAPDALVLSDEHGIILLANRQTELMFGYELGELLGESLEALIPERFRQAHRRHRDAYQTQPSTRPMGSGLELTARRRDGSELPVEISLSHLETVDAHLFVAAIRDVTAIRQAARVNDARNRELARLNVRMQATTRIFDAILGSADIAVARLDSDGVIERVLGSAVEPFFGAVADELTGNPVRRWRADAFSAFEQAVDHGTATELVPGAPSLQRAARIFQCSWLPDDDGVTLVAIDVTDEHQAERRVVLAEDRIRIAADLHDRVIGDVFSAALTVQAATSRLPASETKVKEQLGDVVDQLDVAISELRSAIFELHHRGETSLTDLVTSTVQHMNPTCSVSTTFGHIDDSPLSADVTEQVDAILREAMTNATRHGKATALAVTTSSTPAVTAISITDNGDGFEVGAEQRGNGLNNIIHRAALIGAAIAIDSAPGEGTTITLTLPDNPDAAPTGPLPG